MSKMTSYELIILSTPKPFSHDDDDDDITKAKCYISSIRCGINLIRFICARKILWVHCRLRHNVLLIKLNGEKMCIIRPNASSSVFVVNDTLYKFSAKLSTSIVKAFHFYIVRFSKKKKKKTGRK